MTVTAKDIIIPNTSFHPEPSAIGSFGQIFYYNHIVYWRVATVGTNVLDISSIRELISAINKTTQNTKTPILIDVSDTKEIPSFTPTARAAVLGADFVKYRSAIAFLTNEITRKSIFMHMISNNRITTPLKSFSNETEANSWLQSFLAN